MAQPSTSRGDTTRRYDVRYHIRFNHCLKHRPTRPRLAIYIHDFPPLFGVPRMPTKRLALLRMHCYQVHQLLAISDLE